MKDLAGRRNTDKNGKEDKRKVRTIFNDIKG